MAGIVYLRTNRFEVKLEGITFKAKDFESLCSMDFLFPEGKIWARPPIVGIDVMCHPRDPSVVLLLFCFGVGCMILRFHLGDALPEAILKFLIDGRVRFVGFGIPEKKNLFPFHELGLSKHRTDIGYLAAKVLNDSKYKRCDLAELARKVLGIKKMVGLTDSSSSERHEQMKSSICQLFITSAIGMALLNKYDKKKLEGSPKKTLFLRTFNSLPLFTEGWFKFRKGHENETDQTGAYKGHEFPDENWFDDMPTDEEGGFPYDLFHSKDDYSSGDDLVLIKGKSVHDSSGDEEAFNILKPDNSSKEEEVSNTKKPLKGILKIPTSPFEGCEYGGKYYTSDSSSSSSPEFRNEEERATMRRANSKGFNVSFK